MKEGNQHIGIQKTLKILIIVGFQASENFILFVPACRDCYGKLPGFNGSTFTSPVLNLINVTIDDVFYCKIHGFCFSAALQRTVIQ